MNSLSLAGIDGQHLWGFLTALGSLSLLDEHARENSYDSPRLAFQEDGTAVLQSPVAREHLAEVLLTRLKALQPYLDSNLAGINKPSDFTRSSYETIANVAPTAVDLLAGLACVVGEEPSESTLCAADGAGHQNLVQSMRDILKLVEAEHMRIALFEPWKRAYRVPDDKRKELKLGTRKPTLRLDPSDERLYALRLRVRRPTTFRPSLARRHSPSLRSPCCQLFPASSRSRSRRSVRASESRSLGCYGTSQRHCAPCARWHGRAWGGQMSNANEASSQHLVRIVFLEREASSRSPHRKACGEPQHTAPIDVGHTQSPRGASTLDPTC